MFKTPMQRTALLIVSTLAMLAMATSARSAPGCAMTYETFEHAVPHLDLESCPDKSANTGAFCRLSAGGEKVHIFYFANTGEQCLLKVRSFDEETYKFNLNPR